ncbi:MAG: trigger factor [Gammaproteobacteria bacterium RIFCSPHIGHO2_12_FULL_37_14]|nr:MAG: trigger factor [Gammaproteobacteria bacterium RIFCSPHIGHO2_12_FULL_37_14]
MQVSVEKVSSVECRLTVTVPINRVEEAYNQQIAQYAKKANIKGFRPGKAPIEYIKQRFSQDAWQDAWGEVIKTSLYEAIANNQLHPINTPQIEPKTMLPNQPLEYIASFEVLPEFTHIKATFEQVEKLIVAVKAEDIDQVIQKLRKQHTQWQVVDRPAHMTDRVVIDYYAIFEGKADEANTIKDFPLELGGQTMIPGFEDGLLEVKAGDERTLHLQFPENFTMSERAGKPVDFRVKIKNVYQADTPALDEQFIQKLGISSGNESDLKEQVRQTLQQEADRLVQEKLKDQLFRYLLEQNPIEVPNTLVEREASRIHDEMYPKHHDHAHHQHSDSEMASFKEIATKRVALGLLIGEFVKQEKIIADKDRVQKRIIDLSSVYERPQEVVAWLSSKEQIGNIEAQVLEDQVMDKLLEGVKVVEKNMSYAELKGI